MPRYQALRVGLTGGIGSGKSRVAIILASLGFPIYFADQRAKALMTENEEVRAGVKKLFGKEAYLENGQLNRQFIGQIVFNDPEQLQALNRVVHPATGKDWTDWDQQQREAGHALTFKEAAILYESDAHKGVDRVWAIYAPKSIRLQRAMQRDQSEEAAILSRMDKQWAEWKKIDRADFTLYNEGEHLLVPQVLAALKNYQVA
ncbi:MAG: dephospho-CoA kinase [Bacteroidota bacterium]